MSFLAFAVDPAFVAIGIGKSAACFNGGGG
jgi:hypothetical protein